MNHSCQFLWPFFAALVLSFSLLQTASPQSVAKIEGYVFSITGEPLKGANVVVEGTAFGAATDATGYFSVENIFAGEYSLKASHLGYLDGLQTDVLVRKDIAPTVNFRLQPAAILLEEVVVEATAEHQDLTDFREIITSAQIQRSQARSVAELLRNVPGVEVLDEGGGSGEKRLSIRGSSSNQVLVVLDGVVINNPLVGYADLNQIPVDWIEEIRIWKGGNSSRFGSGALGGVIEVVSKKNSLDKTRIATHFGSFGAFAINPAISGSFKKIKYLMSFEHLDEAGDYPYNYRRLDGTLVRENRLNADFNSQNYFGKLIFEPGRQVIQLQANVHRSHRGLPGQVFFWSPFSRARTVRRIVSGRYVFRGNGWHTRIQFSQYLNKTEFHNDPPADAPLRFRSVPRFHNRFQVLSHQGTVDFGFKVLGRQNISVNSTVRHDDFEDRNLLTGLAGPTRATENLTFGWSLSSDWYLPVPRFVTRIVIRPAVRFDFISFVNNVSERRDRQLSPRLGLLISHARAWVLNLKANWGRSFRAPTFADLFFQDFRVRGNPDLLPEKSLDLDAGWQLGLPLLGWMELEASYFHHDIENQIVWELGSFASFQPLNTDVLLKGWEFSGSWKMIRNRLHFTVSHVILNAVNKSGERTTHNKKLTYRPEHTTKLGIRLNLDFIAIDYRTRWVDDRFVTAANTVRVPGYVVDDLTFNLLRKIKKAQVNLKFSIFNLFDEKYEIIENAPLPGRNWRAGVELSF